MTGKETVEWQYSKAPTTYSDAVSIAARSTDSMVLLQFVSFLPNRVFENHRTMMTKDDLKAVVDDLAEMLDYYPVKKDIKKTAAKTRKAVSK
jgi:hypothetical protein